MQCDRHLGWREMMQRILVIGHEPAIDELAREFGEEHECQIEWAADEAPAISRLGDKHLRRGSGRSRRQA